MSHYQDLQDSLSAQLFAETIRGRQAHELTIDDEPRLLEHMSDDTLSRWTKIVESKDWPESVPNSFPDNVAGSDAEDSAIAWIHVSATALKRETAMRAERRAIASAALVPSQEHAAEKNGGRL